MGRLHPPTHRRFSNSKGNGDAVEFPPLSTRWASRPEKPAKPVLTFAERKTCSIFFTRQRFNVRSIGVSPVTNLESSEAFFHSIFSPLIHQKPALILRECVMLLWHISEGNDSTVAPFPRGLVYMLRIRHLGLPLRRHSNGEGATTIECSFTNLL